MNPNVRNANQGDIPHLMDMARTFHGEVKPEWPWDAEAFEAHFKAWIDHQHVTVSERGFCVGVLVPYPLSPSWVEAHEVFLWAKDGTGAKHARAFLRWVRDNRANAIKWSCRADNARVIRFFNRIATPTDVGFTEVL